MNRAEIKIKLLEIIKEMVMTNVEAINDVPDAVAQQILQNYGCAVVESSENVNDDLDKFVRNLQTWIESKYSKADDSNLMKEETNFELNVYDKFLEAETEYCDVLSELGKVLEEAVKYKEFYSQYFKDECKARETKMDILSKKCQFLKLQFLSKLYDEENALKGHLALREKLKEELNTLKKTYSELVEYNKCMSEVKNNKTFCELFREYKELKKIEEMTEIIGKM